MTLEVAPNFSLELINQKHTLPIFEMVESNRLYLREWLNFVDNMTEIAFAERFVNASMQRHENGLEFAFVIVFENKIVGRIGLYKIDNHNKIGEIGFWIVENQQGKGIIHKACMRLINFAFQTLDLNRIELKCGTTNFNSQKVAEKLHFKLEGTLRQSEVFVDKTIDLRLYSLLKSDV